MPAGRSATGSTSWPSSTSTTSASPSNSCAGRAPKQITFDKVPLDAGDRICRRGRRHRAAAVAAAEAAARGRRMRRASMSGSTSRWCRCSARMERRGIKVDRDYLARLSARVRRTRSSRSRSEIYEAACGPFTIGSPQQLGAGAVRAARPEGRAQGQERAIFDRRQRARAARGARASQCAPLVLEWRQLTKLKSTYTDALQAQINPETGRVHTSFSLTGRADRAAVVERPEPAEHPDPDRDRPQDPRRLRRRAGAQDC